MFGKAIDEVSVADLQALVEARIPEGRRLEFKRDHYGRTDDAKREFAADVSAMANALGGHLLIGIEEENGIASKIVGVDSENPDALVRGITESIRASIEPPILGVRVRWMEIEATRGVLVIQVERSWSAPHRVAVARDNRFFLRDENGKHPMSVNELRRAFLFASEVEDRIRRFRSERLELLIANEGPLAVNDASPRLILHIVPQAAFTEDIQLRFDPHGTGIRPLGASGWNSMYSLDGLVTYSGPEEQFESVRAFSTLFRNGAVEAVGQVYAGERDGRRQLSLSGIEQEIAPALQHILSELQRLSVPPPYYLMLSLVGVRGHCAPTDEWRGGLSYPHRSDKMLLPELMIDEALTKVAPTAILRPLFDLMWNGFGQYGSPNYDRDGNYRLR
ncbi:ATP-binding protein [Zavarzinia compransoris]|uniref:AlbA family DNA-binding domain-containing protein n=1 Tax=Zavarzinia marina TaxID=2911065 RepID=UPI001F2FDEC0|nr:ATP-binding protein [Zavarzinia marina]MCF4166661.1 ATP-binding protein [Zavarzinia marina]